MHELLRKALFWLAVSLTFTCSGAWAQSSVIFHDAFIEKEPEPVTEMSGRALKGPFQIGSGVTLAVLNESLQQTGLQFSGVVNTNNGQYRVAAEIPDTPVEMVIQGFFFDEVTNAVSSSPMELRAITQASAVVNINLLTALESERVRQLVADGVSFSEAKSQALAEIMSAFGFETNQTDSTKIDLNTNDGQALLAITAILMTDADGTSRTVNELQVLLTQLTDDLSDGSLSPSFETTIVESAAAVDAAAFRDNLSGYFSSIGSSASVPSFESAVETTLSSAAYKVSVAAGTGGSASSSGVNWLMEGDGLTISVTPDVGYQFSSVVSTCGGVLNDNQTSYTITQVTADCSVDFSFVIKQYEVSIVVADGGSINTTSPVLVSHGDSLSFGITPPVGLEGISAQGCNGANEGGTFTSAPIVSACVIEIAFFKKFYLAENGVTVMCPYAEVGDTGDVGGVTYTKRTKDQITEANAATTCTSGITDMSDLFRDQSSFNENIGSWDTSSVTNMRSMFQGATQFNQDIGAWNTGSVTIMKNTFDSALAFNQDIGSWDTSSVIELVNMFRYTPFNKDISGWNVSAAENMSEMFYGSAFNQDISNWNVSSVTNMSGMFWQTSAFNQDISGWDVSAVTDMRRMFESAAAFNQDLGGWCVSQIASEPENFDEGANAWVLARPNWGTDCALLSETRVVTASSGANGSLSEEGSLTVPYGRSKVLQVNPDTGYGVKSITGCGGTLVGDEYITSGITADCSITAEFIEKFYLAENGVTVMCPYAGVGDTGDVGGVTYTKRNRDQITEANAATTCTSGITDMTSLFEGATTFNGDISSWDTSSVKSMYKMFFNAASFDQDISQWVVNNVESMYEMFYDAAAFNQDISQWQTGLVKSFGGMFKNTASFDQPVGAWDVSSATSMSFMFENASAFNQDLGNWDVGSVTAMMGMFRSAAAFNQDISAWEVSSVTDMRWMFESAVAFNQDLGSWCVSQIASEPENFDEGANAWVLARPNWGVACTE